MAIMQWTAEEEEPVRAGVAKHCRHWKTILRDPEFAPRLANRTNHQIKDKWRNMCRQGYRRKRNRTTPGAVSTRTAQNIASSSFHNPSNRAQAFKNPLYEVMIFEAFSSINDAVGCTSNDIARYIECKYEVPQNFRRLLNSKLWKLVKKGKLVKVYGVYKIKDAALSANTRSRFSEDKVKEAAAIAAQKIAEAENKFLEAAEATKEYVRVSEMAEEAETVLLFSQPILEEC